MTEVTGQRRAARHMARARRHDDKKAARTQRHAQRGGHAGPGGGRRCCDSRRHGGSAGRGALVEPAIVAALLREGGHGYDLRKSISEMTEDVVSVDAGGLYRTLRRMEEEGFVTSTWVDGDSGPQKREYELTAAGYELAEDWIAHLEERVRLSGLLAEELADALASARKGAKGDSEASEDGKE